MEQVSPLCPVCHGPLPAQSRKTRKYCSTSCRKKASYRLEKDLPLADPVLSAVKATELLQELEQSSQRITRLEALVKRQRQLNAKNRSRALEAQSAIATARNRQRKSEIRVAATYKKLISDYTERIEELEAQNFVLRHQAEEAQQKHAEAQVAAEYLLGQSQHFKKESEGTRRVIAKLQATASAPASLFVDYQYFARWYFHKKPGREWDDHDRNRHIRFKAFISHHAPAQEVPKSKKPNTVMHRKKARIQALKNQTSNQQSR
ncbi:MAG: hypothetical protein Q4A03_02295 [Rothia sp. (in: high G+C Gram-positive bacteria)]|uniref:hypothetical protein n=1 Tax=Rothia sp. (in: high G+C Gram-positive bacteria) TaxID=1885016 RepID=UPI002708F469|nr:hypothetical protein [Rothia sp. (in: high G+C Gram-positive bacteria)]